MPLFSINQLLTQARQCRERGDADGAVAVLHSIVEREPENAGALNNLGLLHSEKGDFEQAAAAFRQALAIQPDLFEAHAGLGIVLQRQGNLDAAKTSYCEALRIRPDAADVHFRLGTIMRAWDRLARAAACFRNALRFAPGNVRALCNLGEALQAAGEIEESEKYFQKAIDAAPQDNSAWSNLFISMNYNPLHSPQEIFDVHCRWGASVAKKYPGQSFSDHNKDPERILRIGYVSADFCRHPAASFLEPLFKNRNRSGFEMFCYSQGKIHDDKTDEFKRNADRWIDIREMDDDAVEAAVRRDAIDILVDCTGHMADNRLPLFARRCAPIQISWIGYPNTTGLATMDYRFTDAVADPPGEKKLFTEELVRLDGCFCCYSSPPATPPVASLPASANGFVTFGSLHSIARLNSAVVALWAAVLKSVPASRLLIFRTTLNQEIIGRLTENFRAGGIGPERVDFLHEVPSEGHLALYNKIDILLDTFPWSGHTTACEALWMGVPVITLRGNRHAGRMVASVLTCLGVSEFIAENENEFVSIAELTASNIKDLSRLRTGLREKMRPSKLCDGLTFAREVEKRYREMWRTWCG
jgi:protein O-GlcNAc transferase